MLVNVPAGTYSVIDAGLGGDTINGGSGSTTVVYGGNEAQYAVFSDGSGGYYVESQALGTNPATFDHLSNVATLQFADQSATPAALSIGQLLTVSTANASISLSSGTNIVIDAGLGGDTVNGGSSSTTVVYGGKEAQYEVFTGKSGCYYVENLTLGSNPSTFDRLMGVTTLQFADASAALSSLSIGQLVMASTANASVSLSSGVNIVVDAGLGGDTINGGSGSTTVVYSGKEAQYEVLSDGSGGYYVESQALGTNPATFDHLSNVATLQFADQSATPAALSIGQLLTVSTANASISLSSGTNIVIDAGLGGDTVNGGSSSTTVVYGGKEAQYEVFTGKSGCYYVENLTLGSNPSTFDRLMGVTTLQFADASAALSSLSIGQLVMASTANASVSLTSGTNIVVDAGLGGDTINGGSGSTTVVYSGKEAQYEVLSDGSGGYYVESQAVGTSPASFDHLTNIATLQFADASAAPSTLSIGQLLTASTANASVSLSSGTNIVIDAGLGGDTVNGGSSSTTVVYGGKEAQYEVFTGKSGCYYVENLTLGSNPSTFDRLMGVTTLQFADASAALSSLSIGQLVMASTANASVSLTSGTNIVVDAGLGGDTINGGSGSTTVVYSGKEAQYQVFADGSGGYYVESQALGTNPATFDHLSNVATLQFADQSATPAALSIGQLLTVSTANASISLSSGTNIVIDAGLGGDTVNGGSSSTTVVYGGKEAQYEVFTGKSGCYYVENLTLGSNPSTFDRLMGVTTLQFADASAALSSLSIGQLVMASTANASVSLTSGTNIVVDAGLGGDTINGGSGSTTVVYSGKEAQYQVFADGSGGYYVESQALGTSPSSFDHLSNVTALQFADASAAPSSLSIGQLVMASTANASISLTSGTNIVIDAGLGGDSINGGSGSTTVVYGGKEAQYEVYADGSGGYYIESPALGAVVSSFDHLTHVSTLQFADQSSAPSALVVGDLLQAGSGAVKLTGTSGSDILIGGSSADTLVGGGGADTFYVNNAGDVVQETPGQGTATVYVSSSSWTATSGSAITEMLAQGTSNIKLVGNGQAMTLVSNTGVDTLDDAGGAATLVGNGAVDSFIVRNAGTMVQALAGSHDTVQTTLSSYTLTANVANLTYIGTGSFYGVGGSVGGTLTGGPGPDTLVSGSGVENLVGGASSNTFYVNNANDVITAPSGSSSVEFSSVSGVRVGVNVSELAFTGTGNDAGYGNSTAVVLQGNSGADTLVGGSGNDTLDGGLGSATLTGGTGTNLFRFDGLTGGVDKISNYVSSQDHIGLSASGFGLTSLSQVSFEFGTSLTPVAGHANVLYNTTTGALYYDAVGGDGHIIQIATLTTHPTLSSSDFVLS